MLATALKDNTHVTELTLIGCSLGAEGAKAIAAGIENNNVLETVNLSVNFMGDAGVQAIADVLKRKGNNSALTCVWLMRNDISDKGAKAIAVALEHNTVLTDLSLACNGIGAEGAQAVTASLGHNAVMKPYLRWQRTMS